ncbi:uncharacterized protein [Engystomops pustulosus]|uniref:uncharacterized protein n=1 Tax=Engystomops pustulosus TaxID=76066 RepID=UPI003AFB703A
MAPIPAAGRRGSAATTAAPPAHASCKGSAGPSQAAPSRHLSPQHKGQSGSPTAQQRQNEAAQQRPNIAAHQRQNTTAQQRHNKVAPTSAIAQEHKPGGVKPPQSEAITAPQLQPQETEPGSGQEDGRLGEHSRDLPLRSPQLPREFVPGTPYIPRSGEQEEELGATPTLTRYAAPSPEWASSPEHYDTEMRPSAPAPYWHTHLQNLPTKEDFKSLITEVKEAFKSEISEVRRDIQCMTQKIDELETAQADSRRQISHTQHTLHSQSVALQDMARHLEDLDNRGRRNNIRVRGIPEVEGKEDISTTLQALFSTLLGEPETQVKLDRANRALRPKTLGGNPRDVICCVHDFGLKERIMSAARKNKNFNFNGDAIQLYQDLSGITLQKRRVLRPLLDILRENGISYRWNFPFALSATKDGITATLTVIEELQEFCGIWNIPTPRLDDWGAPPHQLRQQQYKSQPQQKRRRSRARALSQDSFD